MQKNNTVIGVTKDFIILFVPFENINPKMTPNAEIDIISSMLDAAMTSVDMPFASP